MHEAPDLLTANMPIEPQTENPGEQPSQIRSIRRIGWNFCLVHRFGPW